MYADLQRFLDAVSRLRDLWGRGLVRFESAVQGGAQLVFDNAAVAEQPTPGGGLYNDLGDVLAAVTAGISVDDFIAARTTPRVLFPEPESAETARAKYEAIQPLVEEAGLRASMSLVYTSKLPVLLSHEWEVVNRVADSASQPGAQSTRYGILQLAAQRPQDVYNENVEPEVLVAIVDEQRVASLIDALTRFHEALRVEGAADGEAND